MNGVAHLKWLSRRGYSSSVKSAIGQSLERRKMATEMPTASSAPSARHSDGNVIAFKPRSVSGDDQTDEELQIS